jgi:hypothetical protein
MFAGVVLLFAFLSWQDSDWLVAARGETVRIVPQTADAGRGRRGEWATVAATIKIGLPTPVRILGGTADCSCVAIDNVSVAIEPGTGVALAVRIRLVGTPGRFARRYFFYTDSSQAPYVTGIFTGRVLAGGDTAFVVTPRTKETENGR